MSFNATTFGPTALATPANAVTTARLLVAPVLVALIVSGGPSWWAVAIWVVVASTDWVDGWVARRQGATRSGAFLDPLADKVLVLGALVALVVTGELWWVPVAVIAVREVAMSAYRSYAGRLGVSVPARRSAKVKTWAQALTVGLALVPPVAAHGRPAVLAVLWLAVALTVWTGLQYVAGMRPALAGAARPGAAPARPDSGPVAGDPGPAPG
ncbi:MAG: CDP-alcohol phosphatidyltransferase family protein [Acidimicrobiales bacterium]